MGRAPCSDDDQRATARADGRRPTCTLRPVAAVVANLSNLLPGTVVHDPAQQERSHSRRHCDSGQPDSRFCIGYNGLSTGSPALQNATRSGRPNDGRSPRASFVFESVLFERGCCLCRTCFRGVNSESGGASPQHPGYSVDRVPARSASLPQPMDRMGRRIVTQAGPRGGSRGRTRHAYSGRSCDTAPRGNHLLSHPGLRRRRRGPVGGHAGFSHLALIGWLLLWRFDPSTLFDPDQPVRKERRTVQRGFHGQPRKLYGADLPRAIACWRM